MKKGDIILLVIVILLIAVWYWQKKKFQDRVPDRNVYIRPPSLIQVNPGPADIVTQNENLQARYRPEVTPRAVPVQAPANNDGRALVNKTNIPPAYAVV